MFTKDKGFLIAVIATLIIGSLTYWSITTRSNDAKRKTQVFKSSSKKIDIAIDKAKDTSRILTSISTDLQEIKAHLSKIKRIHEHQAETSKTQNTKDN